EEMIQVLLAFVTVSILVALVFTYYWTKRISTPLESMKRVTEHLSRKNYSSRYTKESYIEIDELGQSINTLAENLDQQMQEIEQNETQLKELINHLVIGVLVIDEKRKVSMVNPVMNQILDEDLHGKLGQDFNSSLHSADLVELIEKAFRKQRIQNKELTLYYPEDKIVDVNVVPVLDVSGTPINYIVLLYDITEIRRLEKVRTDFVANVSHELRTPITAIKGFTETLLDGAMNEEEVLIDFLKIINTESQRLDSMVQDILQLSKLEQRKVIGNIEQVNVADTLSEVEKILHQKIELKAIQFTVSMKQPVDIEIDRDQLKQILLNLIANALAYTPDKGKIHVTVKDEREEVLISVEDTGIGIAKEEQSRIFERFYRVDKARSRNAGGTGLGLSIVKWLVENNNGQLSLESQLGKGSTFSVRLPKTR
ncbi:MAG: two-component system histidine kinase PnpS, partial [Alkalibacterium sp.]